MTGLLPSQGGMGGEYAWRDSSTQPGATYAYWLQEILADGTAKNYGPVFITVDGSITYSE
jgi:hypothetical protein